MGKLGWWNFIPLHFNLRVLLLANKHPPYWNQLCFLANVAIYLEATPLLLFLLNFVLLTFETCSNWFSINFPSWICSAVNAVKRCAKVIDVEKFPNLTLFNFKVWRKHLLLPSFICCLIFPDRGPSSLLRHIPLCPGYNHACARRLIHHQLHPHCPNHQHR